MARQIDWNTLLKEHGQPGESLPQMLVRLLNETNSMERVAARLNTTYVTIQAKCDALNIVRDVTYRIDAPDPEAVDVPA